MRLFVNSIYFNQLHGLIPSWLATQHIHGIHLSNSPIIPVTQLVRPGPYKPLSGIQERIGPINASKQSKHIVFSWMAGVSSGDFVGLSVGIAVMVPKPKISKAIKIFNITDVLVYA